MRRMKMGTQKHFYMESQATYAVPDDRKIRVACTHRTSGRMLSRAAAVGAHPQAVARRLGQSTPVI